MSKFEVWATMWSAELRKQVKVLIGEFDRIANAQLFAKAYEAEFQSCVEIVEYVRKWGLKI